MGKKPTHVIEGVWTGPSSFTSGPRAKKPFADASAANTTREIEVAPIDEQGPMESRRVWRDVADGIRKGNFDQASAAKSKLENDQRQKRKDELAGSKPFQLAFFTHVESDEDCASALRRVGLMGQTRFSPRALATRHPPRRGSSATRNKASTTLYICASPVPGLCVSTRFPSPVISI